MLNQTELKSIVNESPTSKVIFNNLSKRLRFSRKTNLSKFQNQLLNSGEKIVEDEFFDTFKELQKAGAGALVHGRGGKPTRFKWHYDLKSVAKAVTTDKNVEIPELYKKGDRPPIKIDIKEDVKPIVKRFKSAPVEQSASTISITLQLSSDSRPEDIAALLELARQLR